MLNHTIISKIKVEPVGILINCYKIITKIQKGIIKIVGSKKKTIRKTQKISQSDLCLKLDLLGVTMYATDIYEIENNKRLVKDFEVKAISLALNVSIDALYDNTDNFF